MTASKMKFTPSQRRAIDTRSNNVLVSAAAGSGKTAVLIERIIELILVDKLSLGELVVLTFTNDAAKQMKNRLRSKMQEMIATTTDNSTKTKLTNELLVLPLANISTFHAYCIKVLRNHYQYLGLSPTFSIIDENENTLLKIELMEKILEQHFNEEDAVFLDLANLTISRVSTAPLVQLLLDVYEGTRAFVSPEQWREEALTWYTDDEKMTILYKKQNEYFQAFLVDMQKECGDFAQLLAGEFPNNAELYAELQTLFAEIKQCANKNFNAALEMLSTFTFPQFPRIKKDDKTLESERAHKFYGLLRKQVSETLESFSTLEEITMQQTINEPIVRKIFELVEEFEQLFLQVKGQQHKVDFSDIEHFMLALLNDHEAVAEDLSNTITEILVDEYQDTNEIQNAIIDRLRTDNNRLFMVGDVKQSIYRFRLADPTIFLKKELTYVAHGENKVEELITLNQNFRSRQTILDGINEISGELFKLDIEYTQTQALYYGNTTLAPEQDIPIHWHFFEYERDTVNKFEKKAIAIVSHIERLLRDGTIFDKKTGIYRQVVPSDIAILSRNKSGMLINEIESLLLDKKIPFESKTDTGYFDAIEVKNVLSLLAILDNPFDDIAMLGFLRSPMGGFTSNELAIIHHFNESLEKNDRSTQVYYEYLQTFCEQNKQHPELVEKISRFFETQQRFKNKLEIWPLSKCLMYFYHETGYLNAIASLADGESRVANLKMLHELAKRKETIGFISLRHFNRYIDYLQKNDKDFALAKDELQTEEMITMMTIHGSKGLEFPIVLMIDLDKNFNKVASRSLYQIDKEYGFAFRVHDLENRTREKSWQYEFFTNRQDFDDRAEELRILYVALTRAEQSLSLFMDRTELDAPEVLTERQVLSFKSYAEALQAVYLQQTPHRHWIETSIALEEVEMSPFIFEDTTSKIPESTLTLQDTKELKLNNAFRSQGLDLLKFPQKQTVTEIKQREAYFSKAQFADTTYVSNIQKQDDQVKLTKPSFLEKSKKQFSATEIGTYYHLILQHYDYERRPDFHQYIDEMLETHILPNAVLPFINMEKLQQTINELIAEYFEQGYMIVGKELPFSFSKEAKNIYNTEGLFNDERVIVQGKIDMLLKKNEHFVIIDFKSDRVAGIDNVDVFLNQRYQKQIELYEEAVKMYYDPQEIITRIYAIMEEI